ncbi:glyoxalase/bleomycin resistance protein/dioxygenase [Natrialba chahannaoensis JCM 10990]|uniref:Glyoxalase/bleomycin resistance protein/dioxygenase n=1 Tax=Natrialba chahannaoensis JCM 10990 TaxID=1227492 RepID=M0A908_9EURY|nr:VOC family protein [Natrialba chahannaoensis]ELY94856.1 glyoxalase/bleomycin resistance protein/dioxygenase [Natrialba chahannaoensis JCM 10990]
MDTDHDTSDHAAPDHATPEHAGQLHHVELCTTDFESSVDFWNWLLGALEYEPKNEWAGGRSWINGPTYIVVKETDTDDPFDRRAPGLDHLAFHAASRATVDELTAGVRERADSCVLYDDQHPYAGGYYALYCESPTGITVEVVGPE